MIEFKRARTETTIAARRRIWESRCGRFRVVHSRCLFGPRKGPQAIGDRWYALAAERVDGRVVWSLISRHRKRVPAFDACRRAANGKTGSVGV